MVYGYVRVSTSKQDLQGNGLESQIAELVEKGVPEKNIYTDTFTGTTIDRPNLNLLLEKLQSGDTLVVSKLDRIARSVSKGAALLEQLTSKGIIVHVLNIGVLDNKSTSQLMVNMLLAFAQFERDLIVERTHAGKEIAKQNPNFRDGRPKKYDDKKLEQALQLKQTMSYTEIERLTGISKSTLIRYKKSKERKDNNK